MAGELRRNRTYSSSDSVFTPHHPNSRSERAVLICLLVISGIILLVLGVYYILNPRLVIGDSLVNTAGGSSFEIPPAGTFPFYVKPVSVFFVSVIVFSYSLLGLASGFISSKFPSSLKLLLLSASLAIFAICAYETLFNFALWGSILVNQPNPDLAVNNFPIGSSYRISLVYATKSFVAYLFVSYFSISTFKRSLETGRA